MANASKLQLLINSHYGVTADMAGDISKMAEEASTTIPISLAAIGNLMFHATENPDYELEDMRSDMLNIGLLMRLLGNFQVAISTTEYNADLALRNAEKESTK